MLNPGEIVDRYQVVSQIGEGGMAVVYRVKHSTLDSDHALKLLTLSGPSLRDRLIAEGQTQARLRHRNIVRVSDTLVVGESIALVLDYIDGPDLHRWIRVQQPDAVLAEEVFRGIVEGLRAAHDHGVVHRDLKPANVLMAREGGAWVPKVADFGLVKAMEDPTGTWKTRSGIPMGTPTYMAPEQIRDAANVDHRADLFSLGCVLYELVAHRTAFEGEDLLEIFDAVRAGAHNPVPAGVPSHLVRVIDACLQVDPALRPADCSAVLALLDERGPLAAPTQPTLLPPRAPALGMRWIGPAVAVLAAVAVVAPLLLVALIVWTLSGGDPEGACPRGDRDVGWVQGPSLFLKGEGAAWRVKSDTVVRDAADVDAEPVCTLPAGTHLTLVEPPLRQGGVWIRVRGDAIEDPEPDPEEEEIDGAEEPEPDDAPAEAEPPPPSPDACHAAAGELVGWANAKPFFQRQGQTWTLITTKSVYGDYPREANGYRSGPVVCRLEMGTVIDLVDAPIRVKGTGHWIPIRGGAIR